MMPPDPALFTEQGVDSKFLRRRMDLWVEKTFYVLRRMMRNGYNRMARHEATEMVEMIADRMSGLVVAYRHLIDEHVVASYVHHLARLSDVLMRTYHVLRTHDMLMADLYSRAYVLTGKMTPAHVSRFLIAYDIFRADVKHIRFKNNNRKYPSNMDHVRFIRKLIDRFESTIKHARANDLIDAAIGLHTIDARLMDVADRIIDRLFPSLSIYSTHLDVVCNAIYCIALWNNRKHHTTVASLIDRLDALTETEVSGLKPAIFARALYSLGRLRPKNGRDFVDRSRIWFDDRFNGYALLPRDLARVCYGYAQMHNPTPEFVYLLRKQVYRRAGRYRKPDLQMIREAFLKMGDDFDFDAEREIRTGDITTFESVYGHR